MPHSRVMLPALCVFLLIAVVIGCIWVRNARYKDSIQRALHEESLISALPAHERVTALQQVDISGCPKDFTAAYLQYIGAWKELAAAEDERGRLQDQTWSSVGRSIQELSLDPAKKNGEAIDQATGRVNDANAKITKDWESVEDVARKYGVQL